MSPQRWAGMESEITDCLARYLPIGMEGVAAAQARGLLTVLGQSTRSRSPVTEEARAGFRAVREMALEHRPSGRRRSRRECPVCRSAPSSSSAAAWPCRVWDSALAIGVVAPEDAPPLS